mgnify:CR=1 FL=1
MIVNSHLDIQTSDSLALLFLLQAHCFLGESQIDSYACSRVSQHEAGVWWQTDQDSLSSTQCYRRLSICLSTATTCGTQVVLSNQQSGKMNLTHWLCAVAGLDFMLGGAFLGRKAAEVFDKNTPPFCMNCSPYGHCCASPYPEIKAGAWGILNLLNICSFHAVRRSFYVPTSLFLVINLRFW